MEDERILKPSVARLASMFKHQALPVSPTPVKNKPVMRRHPKTLALPGSKDAGPPEREKGTSPEPDPPRSRNRNSALIEKLQANLSLSPMALLPQPKSPGMLITPTSPCTLASPSLPPQSKEEASTSFESPADGGVLLSINKSRARLSIKRRPPSRRYRKLSGDETGDTGGKASPDQLATAWSKRDVFDEKTSDGNEIETGSTVSECHTKTTDLEKSGTETIEKVESVSEETSEAPVEMEKMEKTEEQAVDREGLAQAQRRDRGSELSTEQATERPPDTDALSDSNQTQDKEKEEKSGKDGESRDTVMVIRSE